MIRERWARRSPSAVKTGLPPPTYQERPGLRCMRRSHSVAKARRSHLSVGWGWRPGSNRPMCPSRGDFQASSSSEGPLALACLGVVRQIHLHGPSRSALRGGRVRKRGGRAKKLLGPGKGMTKGDTLSKFLMDHPQMCTSKSIAANGGYLPAVGQTEDAPPRRTPDKRQDYCYGE